MRWKIIETTKLIKKTKEFYYKFWIMMRTLILLNKVIRKQIQKYFAHFNFWISFNKWKKKYLKKWINKTIKKKILFKKKLL